MTVFGSTRTITGTDTPTVANSDGAFVKVSGACVVTLTNTSWTVGRSAIAFQMDADAALTFTEGASVTIVAANSDETIDVQYESCVAVYTATNTWTINKGVNPADFEAAGAVSTHAAVTTSVHGIADTSALLDTGDIGSSVQAHDAVLDATTASFTTADETKLDGIETAATADQTGAQIKAAYEAEADTNAFTDAEQTKLSGIEAAADVTDATNVTAAGAHMSGGTDVPVTDGGTGASTASGARTALGVAIGSDVQAYSATLSDIKDEDDMVSDSDEALATQQSIKAYVDANAGGGGDSTFPIGAPAISGGDYRNPGVTYYAAFADTLVADRGYYEYIYSPRAFRVSGYAVAVYSAAGTAFRFALVKADGDTDWQPNSSGLIGQDASIDPSTTGVKAVTGLTWDCDPGLYIKLLVCNGAVGLRGSNGSLGVGGPAGKPNSANQNVQDFWVASLGTSAFSDPVTDWAFVSAAQGGNRHFSILKVEEQP